MSARKNLQTNAIFAAEMCGDGQTFGIGRTERRMLIGCRKMGIGRGPVVFAQGISAPFEQIRVLFGGALQCQMLFYVGKIPKAWPISGSCNRHRSSPLRLRRKA